MSLILYVALIALSCAWLFLLPIFARPSPTIGFSMIGVSIVLIALSLRRAGGGWRNGARTLFLLASLILAQFATLPVIQHVGSRIHRLDFLAQPAAWILRAGGINARAEDGLLFTRSADGLLNVSVSWEKLGLVPAAWIALAVGFAYVGLSRRHPLRSIIGLIGCLAAFLTLRFAALVVLLAERTNAHASEGGISLAIAPFSEPLWQAVSFAPLAIVLARLLPWNREELAPQPWRFRFVAIASSVAAGALLAFGVSYQDPGVRKPGRVVLDELHSGRWEHATVPLDRSFYGRSSVYTYSTYLAWLQQHYSATSHLEGRYTDEVLADTDVLILKTPTVPFEPGELDAIERFVERGGGLFLIGDHTDLLGMSTNMNALSERFRIHFNLDGCNRLEDGQFHDFSPSFFDNHPVTLPWKRIEFMTSCTLDAPILAEDAMVVGNTFSDPVDYSSPSFFGNMIPDSADDFGYNLLSVARKVGAGRVLAFSDSTIFSTFAVMYDDRPDFALACVEYLNRSNTTGYAWNKRSIGVGAALLLVALVAACASANRRGLLAQVLPMGAAAGVLLGSLCARHSTERAYPLPERTGHSPEIAFVKEISDFELPAALGGSRPSPLDSYDTFYVWTQRTNAFPRIRTFEDALRADAVALIRPVGRLDSSQLEELECYVSNGGRLLVLESVWNARSTTNQITQRFGLYVSGGFRNEPMVASPVPASAGGDGSRPSWFSPMLHILGGTPLATTQDGHVVLASAEYGRGRVVLMVDAAMFSCAAMGEQTDEVEPDAARRGAFAREYEILDLLLGDRGHPAPTPDHAAKPE